MRYALIDENSGYVWWVGDADTPEAACEKAAWEVNAEDQRYERDQFPHIGQLGRFHVYAVPQGFDVEDGRDDEAIAATQKHPRVGVYAEIREG